MNGYLAVHRAIAHPFSRHCARGQGTELGEPKTEPGYGRKWMGSHCITVRGQTVDLEAVYREMLAEEQRRERPPRPYKRAQVHPRTDVRLRGRSPHTEAAARCTCGKTSWLSFSGSGGSTQSPERTTASTSCTDSARATRLAGKALAAASSAQVSGLDWAQRLLLLRDDEQCMGLQARGPPGRPVA